VPPTTTGTIPRTSLPTRTVADVTPRGWVPVDFGSAQVSVPAAWHLEYDTPCKYPSPPGTLYVGAISGSCPAQALGHGRCHLVHDCPSSTPVVYLFNFRAPGRSATRITINGLSVGKTSLGDMVSYQVPALGVWLTARGRNVVRVLQTLTRSPAAIVLAAGPVLRVPKSWKWVTAGGLRLAVPPTWPTLTSDLEGAACVRELALGRPDAVVLDSDRYIGSVISCPAPAPFLIFRHVMPDSGVVVDLHPERDAGWPPGSGSYGDCLVLGVLRACPYERSLSPMTRWPRPTSSSSASRCPDALATRLSRLALPGTG
jgi:hypothetical protein